MSVRSKSHWQPKMEKTYLIDDLNDWIRQYAGGSEIKSDTHMTIHEIELIIYAFQEMRKKERTK